MPASNCFKFKGHHTISEVHEKLKLTAGKQHWSHVFHTAFKALDATDAALLEREMQGWLSGQVA